MDRHQKVVFTRLVNHWDRYWYGRIAKVEGYWVNVD